jgi:hypothetical protein
VLRHIELGSKHETLRINASRPIFARTAGSSAKARVQLVIAGSSRPSSLSVTARLFNALRSFGLIASTRF